MQVIMNKSRKTQKKVEKAESAESGAFFESKQGHHRETTCQNEQLAGNKEQIHANEG